MKRLLKFNLLVILCLPYWLTAQTSLLAFKFNGNTGNEASVNSFFNEANVSPSSITRGTGLNVCNNGDRYCATMVNAATVEQAVAQQEYFEFTLQQSYTDCILNFHSITIKMQRSATGAKQIVLRSSNDNFTNNIGAIGTINESGTTTITFSGDFILTASTTFRIYIYSASATGGTVGFEGGAGTVANPDILVKGTLDCSNVVVPTHTLTISNANTSALDVDCAATIHPTVTLDYTSDATFTASNSYTVELSTPTGTFPGTSLMVEFGFSPNGNLSFIIPSTLVTGNYLLRIKSLDPALTSNTLPLNITQIGNCTPIPPHLRSILYDGCDGPCGSGVEGLSEILFGNSGSYSFVANTANIDLYYSTGGYNMTTNVVSNPTKITQLNAAAGCANLFVDANIQTVPANSAFLLVSENICIEALSWSSLCGTGPIYVIFGQESTSNGWRRNGNFGNSGNAKNFYLRIANTENTSTVYYRYTPIATADGNYATYNIDQVNSSTSGNPILPSSSGNFPDCSLTPVALNHSLIYFIANQNNENTTLSWKIREDRNTSHYIIEKYNHQIDQFDLLARVPAHGEDEVFNYRFDTDDKQTGNEIYRLTANNHSGKQILSAYTNLEAETKEIIQVGNIICYPSNHHVELFSVDGKNISANHYSDRIEVQQSGIVIVRDWTQQKSYRFFVQGE